MYQNAVQEGRKTVNAEELALRLFVFVGVTTLTAGIGFLCIYLLMAVVETPPVLKFSLGCGIAIASMVTGFFAAMRAKVKN